MNQLHKKSGHCEEHGDFIVPGFSTITDHRACPACGAQVIEEDRQAEIDQLAESERLKKFYCPDLPPRYRRLLLDSYRADNDGQKRALAKVRAVLAGEYSHLLMVGKPGTGKTHLGAALCREWAGADKGVSRMVKASAMIRRIRESWRADSKVTEDAVLREFTDPDLMVIDEVGASHNTEDEKRLISEVMSERYDWERSTVMISNMTQKEVADVIGDRAYDRLKDAGCIVVSDWESERG